MEWQDIGYGLEAQIRNDDQIWVRSIGQKNDHHHSTIYRDQKGNFIGFENPDPRSGRSLEGRQFIINLVKEELLNKPP